MAICQYMLFSPPSLIPELKDWLPSLPTTLTRASRLEEVPLQQLGIIGGLEYFTNSMNITADGVEGIITESRGNRAELVAGLKAVYPDLLNMEINIFSDLIHKLEVQRQGRDAIGGDTVIRRDDIKRSVQQSLAKTNSRTEGILFWLDWSRDEADIDIFTSRPPILPDLSGVDDYIFDTDDVGDAEEDDDEDDADMPTARKVVKNAKVIASVSRAMLKLVENTTIDTPNYSAARPTIEGII
jgi:hypothetical protein